MNNNIKIDLYNRYCKGLYLRQVEKNIYQLHGPDMVFEYMRIGYTDDKCSDIQFIDPAGGPFIQLGTEIAKNIVKKIHQLKDDDGKYYFLIETEKG